MKNNRSSGSPGPTFVIISSLIYTALVLMLTVLTVVPSAKADSVTVFTKVSNATQCARAAKMASRNISVSRDAIVNCNLAIRTERLKDDDLALTYNNRGVLYKKMARFSKALNDYYSARNINREFVGIYVNIGNVFFGEENFDAAIRHYDKALRYADRVSEKNAVSPDTVRWVALTNRGMANERRGHLYEAISDYRAALGINADADIATKRLMGLQAVDGADTAALNDYPVLDALVSL